MRFEFSVSAEVERSEGKFASRDEIAQVLQEWLENCNEGEITTDNDATYTVDDWAVDEQEQPKRRRRR